MDQKPFFWQSIRNLHSEIGSISKGQLLQISLGTSTMQLTLTMKISTGKKIWFLPLKPYQLHVLRMREEIREWRKWSLMVSIPLLFHDLLKKHDKMIPRKPHWHHLQKKYLFLFFSLRLHQRIKHHIHKVENGDWPFFHLMIVMTIHGIFFGEDHTSPDIFLAQQMLNLPWDPDKSEINIKNT